jgi:iron(III) transport system substrate-binding protein
VLSALIRRKWPIPVIAVLLVVAAVVGVIVTSGAEEEKLVIYNGRAHYGNEEVFDEFIEQTGIEIELRGGNGPELFERLRREGDDTPADVLITTDMANLWRAKDAGLLQPADSPTLEENIPEGLHDAEGYWWAISTRMRVPVVNTDAIDPADITSYADLGDPQYRGRTCLRTSSNEYNQSLVADMIAKRGREATKELLESWMANDPEIIPSDGEMLEVIAAGDCDLGLSNHYYLGRILKDDPDFPVAPAFPDQDGAGAHTNVSGLGIVAGTDDADLALRFLEFMTSVEAEDHVIEGSEFPANPDVPAPEWIADWADAKQDPIVADEAGPLLGDAVDLMAEVGWR